MRILLCHRFFWPDTPPYASMLRTIGQHLANEGHEVHLLSAQPGYHPDAENPRQPAREHLDGIAVRRVPLLRERRKDLLFRGLNAVLFSVQLFAHVLFSRRYDVVMTSTFPPILLALLGCMATRLRGGQFVYHCMDLHPEVSLTGGGGRERLPARVLKRLDQWTCRHAAAVVVLSEDMRQTLIERTPDRPPQTAVINNFPLPAYDDGEAVGGEVARLLTPDPDRCRFVFAGNLGRFQHLETVVEAAARLNGREEFELVLVGEGAMKPALQTLVHELGCTQVSFVPFQPPSVAQAIVGAADFGLVTLAPGVQRAAYPSKTLTYLATGCPLLVMVDEGSEITRTVADNRLGLVVVERTAQAVATALEAGCEARDAWRARRADIATWAQEHHSSEVVMSQWDDVFARLRRAQS